VKNAKVKRTELVGRLVAYDLGRYAEMNARSRVIPTLDTAEEIFEIVKGLGYLAPAIVPADSYVTTIPQLFVGPTAVFDRVT
jgi:hypothetical protein